MSTKRNDNIRSLTAKPLDDKWGVFEDGLWRPFNNFTEFDQLIPIGFQFETQLFWIRNTIDANKADLYVLRRDKSKHKILADIDLSNYYTQDQIDSLLDDKAESSDVYTKNELNNLLDSKVDEIPGKGLSENDFTDADKTKLDNQSGTNTGDQDLSNLATRNSVSQKTTIAFIRALSGILQTNYYSTIDIGQEGNWYYDSTDTTSIDNTGLVLVTSDGKRIKRIFNGYIDLRWFGNTQSNGIFDNTTIFNIIENLSSNYTDIYIGNTGSYFTTRTNFNKRYFGGATIIKSTGELLLTIDRPDFQQRAMFAKSSDFITRLSNASPSRTNVYLRYAGLGSTDTVGLGINFADGNTSEFFIRKDPSNLFLLRGGFVGKTISPVDKPVLLAGTDWITLSEPQIYTRHVGDTFSFTFFGTGFYFNSYKDTRGGLWKFHINETNEDIIKSVWASNDPNTGPPIVSTVVKEDLNLGNYNVVATFMGDDPDHAPSDTARGWLRRTSSGQESIGVYNPVGTIGLVKDEIMQETTIVEFAINGRAADDPGTINNWIPCHSSNVGATRNITTKIFADKNQVDILNLSTMPLYINLDKVTIIQNYTAYNEIDIDGNYPLWDGTLTHSFDKDGLQISHVINLNKGRDFKGTIGYMSMFASNLDLCDKFMLGNRIESISVPSGADTNTGYNFVYDSVAYASTSKSCVAAFKTNINLCTQIERKLISNGDMFRIERADKAGKTYWKATSNNQVLKAGNIYRSEVQYLLAKVQNINSI